MSIRDDEGLDGPVGDGEDGVDEVHFPGVLEVAQEAGRYALPVATHIEVLLVDLNPRVEIDRRELREKCNDGHRLLAELDRLQLGASLLG